MAVKILGSRMCVVASFYASIPCVVGNGRHFSSSIISDTHDIVLIIYYKALPKTSLLCRKLILCQIFNAQPGLV